MGAGGVGSLKIGKKVDSGKDSVCAKGHLDRWQLQNLFFVKLF